MPSSGVQDVAEDWGALETALDEKPLFFVEARDKDAASELARVKRFRSLFRKHFSGARIVAIPNGGIRSQRALNQARSEGAAWGFPDMLAIGSSPFIPVMEWKSGTGALKQHQISWMNWMHSRGHPVGMFRVPETAIAWLFEKGFRA
jgi:hypothetical protein